MPVLAKPLDELCREGQLLTSSQGRDVYAVTYEGIRAPMAVKHLSIPATQTMVSGLIYSGAVADEAAALAYYTTQMEELKQELALLAPLRDHPHFLPYLDVQIKEKTDGIGYDVYLLTLRATTVRQLMAQYAFTYRSALALGVGALQALCALREQSLLHRDLKPENLYQDPEGTFRLGDLGVLSLDDLAYATQPDHYISPSTAPELCDVLGTPNETIDTYAVGSILWTIFNGYVPMDEEQRRSGAAPGAPQYAPTGLAEVLCRACAPNPEDRYPTPAEMLAALEPCLAEADDALILAPPAEPEAPEETAAPEPTPEAAEAPEAVETPEPVEPVASMETTPAAPMAPEPEASAEPAAATVPPAMDELHEMPVPAIPFEDEAPAAPAPAPEPAPEPEPAEVTYLEGETLAKIDIPESLPEPSQRFRSAFAAAYEDDEDEAVVTTDPSRVHGHRRRWWKVAIPLVLVALIAAGAFAVVNYLRNRCYVIDQLTLTLEGSDALRVSVVAPAEAPLTVTLTDAGGRVLQSVPYAGEDLYFDDLEADTEYAVTLQSTDGLPLEGVTSNRAVTPMPTELLSFEAVAQSPTEIALEFSSTGYEPEHWTLTFSNAEGESQTSSFTGHSLVIEGLDAGSEYTFTITDAENQPVLGNSTVTCATETVVNLTSFELDDSVYGELTVRWSSTGNFAKSWTVTCSGTDGSYRTEEITEQSDQFSYTFEDLPAGIAYEVQLACEGLTNEEDATRNIELPLCTVTDFVAYASSATSITVSWNYIDGEQPERWHLTCTNVGTGESQIYALADNHYELTGLLPQAEYRFELGADNGLLVGGCEPTTATTIAAPAFDDYETSGIFLGFFALPTRENWGLSDLVTSTREFSAGEGLAFAVEVSYEYTAADKQVSTLYIIRDAAGQIVRYSTGELSWEGSSVKETHYGGFEQGPDTPGEYTLEIYFNNELLTSKTFTVS